MTKTERQLQVVNKWIQNKFIGTLVGLTGFGKTRTAIECAKVFNSKFFTSKDIKIVVPTINLKNQWEQELTKEEISAEVIVINTASKLNLICGLLIIDEVHTSAAPTFKYIFDNIKYEALFNITATIERTDGMHELLLEKAPIIDEIDLEECLANNWISNYVVYNIETPFSEDQQTIYNKANNSFKHFAMKIESFETAKLWMLEGTSEQKGQASAYFNLLRKRKELITNNKTKVTITLEILNRYKDEYAIVFSESIEFADTIEKLYGSTCASLHSKKSNKLCKYYLKTFGKPENKTKVLASCRSLILGIDAPFVSLGIVSSFNSSKLNSIQSIGRVIRPMIDKQAKIFNLYTPNTQEVNWLKKKQEGQQNIIWIKSVKDIPK